MTNRNLWDQKSRLVGTFLQHMAKRDDSGQAFIELALSLSILIVLLTGAAEYGRLAYASIEVTNAARAGVAYGAQNHITASDNTGMQNAATNDGSNIAGLSATATHFCNCSNSLGTVSSCAPTACSGARIIEFVQVNTTAAFDPLFYVPGLPRTYNLTGQAVMRVEQ